MRSRALIKFVLQAASALQNTDCGQRSLRKFFRLIITIIRQFPSEVKWQGLFQFVPTGIFGTTPWSVGPARLKTTVPFWQTGLISRISSVDFQLYRGLEKVRVIQLSVGPVWSENIVPLFFSYSSLSLITRHNGKKPTIGAKLLIATTYVVYHLFRKNWLVDGCSKWDASNAEWKFQRGCRACFISTTFSRKTGPKMIQFKRPGTIRNQQIKRAVSIRKFRLGLLVYLSRNPLFLEIFPFREIKLIFPFTLHLKFPGFWGVNVKQPLRS